jgi:hypothetical protein
MPERRMILDVENFQHRMTQRSAFNVQSFYVQPFYVQPFYDSFFVVIQRSVILRSLGESIFFCVMFIHQPLTYKMVRVPEPVPRDDAGHIFVLGPPVQEKITSFVKTRYPRRGPGFHFSVGELERNIY